MKLVTHKDCEADPDTMEMTRRRSSYKDCKHMQVEVDDELRIVKCKRCGETLDPIQVLLNIHSYVEGIRLSAERVDAFRKQEREKNENRRMKCRRCKKLFKPTPDDDCEYKCYSHWGICNPCWAINPKHAEATA